MKTLFIDEKEKIDQVIKECDVCSLGVIDEDNLPYVVPMNFGLHDGYIYLHGAGEGKLIEAIRKNPNVCITFCTKTKLAWQDEHVACSYRIKGSSVVARGKVEFITDYDQKVDALNILMANYTDRKFTYNSPAVKNVEIYRLKMDNVTGKEYGVPNSKKFPWQIKRDQERGWE
ncbi:MAG: pyridoxamine 5'-phosphate oxidase family protein [Marinifilaceae bacterium]